jgi:hypothetical protein
VRANRPRCGDRGGLMRRGQLGDPSLFSILFSITFSILFSIPGGTLLDPRNTG